jgi:cytochrome c oxidase subunit 4
MDTTHGASRIGDGHEEPHGHTEPMPHHKVPYFLIFGLLVLLTFITVGVAFIDIKSEIAKVLLALAIASVKASAVALFFMHLKFEGKLIYLILIVPLLLCVLLVVALIPDIVYGAPFDRMTHLPGPQPPH